MTIRITTIKKYGIETYRALVIDNGRVGVAEGHSEQGAISSARTQIFNILRKGE